MPLQVTYHILDQFGRPARNRRLFHDDGAQPRMLDHHGRDSLEGRHIRCAARPRTARLRRRVHGDNDDISLADAARDVGGEGQVRRLRALPLRARRQAVPRDAHHLGQAGLVDGQVPRVPSPDAALVPVDDGDSDAGVLEGDDGGRWASCLHVNTALNCGSLRFREGWGGEGR